MRRKLFTIEDRFQIAGRGLVIVGKAEKDFRDLRIKSPLIIVRPDGREIETYVGGIEMLNPPNFEYESVLILELTKEDLPKDSEVYIEE